eukprot:scaffold70889_cov45-Phaeocystis_antarctica.AAC.2
MHAGSSTWLGLGLGVLAGSSTSASSSCTVSSSAQKRPKWLTTSQGERPPAARPAAPTAIE